MAAYAFIKKNKKKLLLLLFLVLIVPFLFVKRLARPEISGNILDFQGQPIQGCKVGETLTDENGYYRLPAKTYQTFFIPELLYLEAPPLFVHEHIRKDGYNEEDIHVFHRYGGGLSSKTKWKLDPIHLRKTGEKVEVSRVLNGKWKISMSPESDTLFLIRANLVNNSTLRLYDFFSEYRKYTSNSSRNDKRQTLPDGIADREIEVEFKDKSMKFNKIIQYDREDRDKTIDTISGIGTWKTDNEHIKFITQDGDLEGSYKVLKDHLHYLQLKRVQQNNR